MIKPTAASDVEPVWHVYAIQVEQRDRVAAFLEQKGIRTGVHYPLPVHRQAALRGLGYEAGHIRSPRRLPLVCRCRSAELIRRACALSPAPSTTSSKPHVSLRRDEDARRVATLRGAQTTPEERPADGDCSVSWS